MHRLAPSSISSLETSNGDDASPVREFNHSFLTSPASTAPQPSSLPIESKSHVSDGKDNRKSLKSSLKISKSTTTLAVRFSVPETSSAMPGLEQNVSYLPRKDIRPSQEHQDRPRASLDLQVRPPVRMRVQDQSRASLDLPVRTPVRMSVYKHISTPAPISRRPSQNFTTPSSPPSPSDPWLQSIISTSPERHTSRVASFQSVASAPAVLQSLAPEPSDSSSQYNPMQHYIPCLAPNCKAHYTESLLGPTFYFRQAPYELIRSRGLCPFHAHQDLKIANQRVKSTYESMRQKCGRKTIGVIAAEFEVFVQQVREERAQESERMSEWQKQRVLSMTASKSKGKEKTWEEEWDWRFSLRQCSKKGCEHPYYSPFDSRLYLFYTTPRPSGLFPLSTLCPSCAKEDVNNAEDRIENRMRDVGGVLGPEWEEWYLQVGRDREMEVEYWESAQENLVRENLALAPMGVTDKEEKGTKQKKGKRGPKLDVCVVM